MSVAAICAIPKATASPFVVINTTTGGLEFDGSIVLTGGITSDHVLFNFDAGNFDTLSGGDTLTIDTDGNTTTGIFLDPNGAIHIGSAEADRTVINGRIFGGDTADMSIVNADIVAPSIVPPSIPEPGSLALLGAGLIALGMIGRRHRVLLARS